MHELSIAQNIVDIIGQYVPAEQSAGVRSVRVKVGPLAGVVPDSLDFCFDAIVTGTPLSRARLDIEETLVKARCSGCGAAFEVEGTLFLCSRCGSADIEVVSGTELQVVEIEMVDSQAESA